MHKGRLEAFSDGVIAIIITIMVLELKTPHVAELSALKPMIPIFISYLLSFVFVAIYWNNHHHLMQPVQKVNGAILWANMHLLFWLSLVPFTTAWMGENNFASWPVSLYGVVLLLAGVAYFVLTRVLLAHHAKDSALSRGIGSDFKGKVSIAIYAVAIFLSFWNSKVAYSLYAWVAVMWLVPDKRIERVIAHE